jgi:hypothetical protein
MRVLGEVFQGAKVFGPWPVTQFGVRLGHS